MAILAGIALAAGVASAAQLKGTQSGTTTLAGGSTTTVIALSPAVDITRAFLTFGVSENTADPQDGQVSGQITSPTAVTFQRTGTTGVVTIQWSVVEFQAGVSVRRGSIDVSAGSPANVALIPAVNTTKSFPLISYRTTGVNFNGDDFVRAKITTGANLQLSYAVEAGAFPPLVVEWQVVEYQDANVQTGDVTFGGGDGSLGAPLTAVNIAKSWLIYNYESDATAIDPIIGNKMLRGVISGTTTLNFDRSLTGPGLIVTWYLVEFTDATVVQSGTQAFGGGTTVSNVALPTPAPPGTSIATSGGDFLRGGRSAYAANDVPGVAWFTSELTASDNLRITRGAGLGAASVGWFVLTFPPCDCQSLTTTEGAGTVTVTAPASFEMRFNAAVGGGIDELFDLAEDPAKTYDLAGGVSDLRTLHDLEVAPSGGPFAGINHQTDDNSASAKVVLLEATPTRVRVRQDAFFQQDAGSNILGGLKGIGDYSVYGTGRTAFRWTQTDANTPAFNYARRQIGMTAHYTAGLPLSDYTPCYEANPACDTWGGGGAQADFVLGVRDSANARTDFLTILSSDWAQATTIEYLAINLAGVEFSDQVWQEQPGGGANAAPSQSWNLLTYFKPTSLGSTGTPWLDPAVLSRSTDYRTHPAAEIAINAGSQWEHASENTSAGTDWFNEAEAAYPLDMSPTLGLDFDIDGSAPRYSPFFKIRQWQSLSDTPVVTLDGVPLTKGVDYRSDLKPLSRAYWASTLTWHCTMESTTACDSASIDVGAGVGASTNGATAATGKYGSGLLFTANADSVTAASADFSPSIGAVDFWYQPRYASGNSLRYLLWYWQGGTPGDRHCFIFEKTAANTLVFSALVNFSNTVCTIADGNSASYSATVPAANFSWRAYDWVHLKTSWNSAGGLRKLRIVVDGVEAAFSGTFVAPGSTSTPIFGGCTGASCPGGVAGNANGVIDEAHIYGGLDLGGYDTNSPFGYAGLATDASEYLADPAKNWTLSLTPVVSGKRGSYLYFGADSTFRGLNVALQTAGVWTTTPGDLVWEFWNGTQWASLESGIGFTDSTIDFTEDGTVYWTGDPAGWSPYSVNGGPDLYYVRLHLAGGLLTYSTLPREGLIKTDVLLFQYCGDVTLGTQTFDFDPPMPTAVTLSSFSAAGHDSAVALSWTTATELQNLGFHLYRADSKNGPYARITAAVVPGLGSSPHGAAYSYTDSGLSNGAAYFYKLEDIETTGKTTLHGPVSATPSSAASVPAPTRANLITYGNPEGNSFRVLSQSAQGVVLELVTEGFLAEPQGDGTVRISIPGFEPASGLSLPVLRPWVEASLGRNVVITSVQTSAAESFTGLRPAGAESPEIVATREGIVRAGRRPRRASLGTPGLFPEEAARLLGVGFQGDAKKAQLELVPLRWNGSSSNGGELLFARKLTVHLAFRGLVASERGHRERASHGERNLLARLATTEKGLYEVRYEDVFRTRRGVGLNQLRLSRLGQPVAFHVEPEGQRFSPGSRLYFVSQGSGTNPYAREAVYELGLGAGGLVMEPDSASPSGEELASYLQTDDYEENRLYQAGLLEAPDLWLWDVLMAPSTKSFSFGVKDLRPGSSRLTAWLQGVSDFDAHPDHHVRVYVNGAFQQELFLDGKEPRTAALDLPPGTLREGENRLEIENADDTEAPYSMVMLDRFQVVYPRAASAEGGRLEGVWTLSGTASVQGLGASHLLDVTEEAPRWLSRAELSADGGIRFRADAGRNYLAVSHDAVLRPHLRTAARPRLRKETLGAGYLVIAPGEFSPAAAPLLAHRAQQGLRVKFAALEDVYSEFGFGEARPEAIRDFLSYAYHHWREPKLRYVLLLGDATYDFKNYLETGVTNQLPPLMVKTSYLWTVSDPALGAVHGDDVLPDVAIGRLPAKNPEELRVMVSKILAYETGEASLESLLVLVNDNSDRAGDFSSNAAEIAAGVLSGRPVRRLSLDELGGAPLSMRSEILRAFDQGASLVSYAGHGGIHLWASENVLNISDVASLSPQSQQPLLLTMNCLNGYFHFPYFDSLAETLVKAEGKGAVAAFSPSGLSLNEPAHRFHQALLDAVFNQGHLRLGDAVLAAQEDYAESGAFPELLSIYHLLGDPGLRLR